MEVKGFTLSIIVANRPGVLLRVVSLFAKRGYNIDNLYVSAMAENNAFSRIIMTSSGDDATKVQIGKQLKKLHDIKEVNFI